MRLQSRTLCRPLAGLPLFPGLRRVLFTTRLFPEAWGKLGPGGLGRDGSGEGRKSGGQCWARESAWRERKQVAEASPAPCLETFPRVGWPVPLGLGTRSAGVRGSQRAPAGSPANAGGPGGLRPGPCQGSGYHVSHFQMCWNLLQAQTAASVAWSLAAGHPHYYSAFPPLSSLSRPPSDHSERQETQTQIELIAPCYLPSLPPEGLPSPSRNPEWPCPAAITKMTLCQLEKCVSFLRHFTVSSQKVI